MERCIVEKIISVWNNRNKETKESKTNIIFNKTIKAWMMRKDNEMCWLRLVQVNLLWASSEWYKMNCNLGTNGEKWSYLNFFNYGIICFVY